MMWKAQSTGNRRAIKTLLDLDDHQLDDIGYTRSALEWALGEEDPREALKVARDTSRRHLRLPARRAI